jgi:hypothetical protein
MDMNKNIKATVIILTAILVQGCLSTARLSDFSQTAKGYDFNIIAAAKKTSTDKGWNSKTGFEYYIKANVTEDSLIIKAITGAMMSEGFSIKLLDITNCAILGERGLKANEWNSVAGVYYQKNNDFCEMYINCKITQDFTGGWREDRASKIGDIICRFLKSCEQSYSVNTSLQK